jgi:NADPH-dependent curcumin reductase CurA
LDNSRTAKVLIPSRGNRTRTTLSAEGSGYIGKMTSGKEVSNKQVLLKHYVVRWPKEDVMELVTTTKKLDLSGDNEVLVKVLYLSCDPPMRGRMTDSTESYIPPFQPGQVR